MSSRFAIGPPASSSSVFGFAVGQRQCQNVVVPAEIPDLNTPGVPRVGALLVATPEISQGIFRRSVILLALIMTSLDRWGHPQPSDGSGGRRCDAGWESVLYTNVAEEVRLDPIPRSPWPGCPGIGWPDPTTGLQRLSGPWALVDLESDPDGLVEVTGGAVVRRILGLGPGQLAGELHGGAWWVVESHPADLALARQSDPQTMWRTVLRRQSGDLRFAATFPDDPRTIRLLAMSDPSTPAAEPLASPGLSGAP